jgi:hypothetical protein
MILAAVRLCREFEGDTKTCMAEECTAEPPLMGSPYSRLTWRDSSWSGAKVGQNFLNFSSGSQKPDNRVSSWAVVFYRIWFNLHLASWFGLPARFPLPMVIRRLSVFIFLVGFYVAVEETGEMAVEPRFAFAVSNASTRGAYGPGARRVPYSA